MYRISREEREFFDMKAIYMYLGVHTSLIGIYELIDYYIEWVNKEN